MLVDDIIIILSCQSLASCVNCPLRLAGRRRRPLVNVSKSPGNVYEHNNIAGLTGVTPAVTAFLNCVKV